MVFSWLKWLVQEWALDLMRTNDFCAAVEKGRTPLIAGVAGIGCKAGERLPEKERRVGLDDILWSARTSHAGHCSKHVYWFIHLFTHWLTLLAVLFNPYTINTRQVTLSPVVKMSPLLINGRAGTEHRSVSKSLLISLDTAFEEKMARRLLYFLNS